MNSYHFILMNRTNFVPDTSVSKIPVYIIRLINWYGQVAENNILRSTCNIPGWFDNEQGRNGKIIDTLYHGIPAFIIVFDNESDRMQSGDLIKVIWIPLIVLFIITKVPFPFCKFCSTCRR